MNMGWRAVGALAGLCLMEARVKTEYRRIRTSGGGAYFFCRYSVLNVEEIHYH